jgi:lipopolysaccharide/colanic/teichoic acid biosynthesis glycosyltransferase/nucleoside-diphosphate-sugar epimerase
MSKRVCDAVLAGVGLALVWPLLAIIAVLVKLDSRGPVLFRQSRVGRHGKPFRILKFRTMVANAPSLGPRLTQKRDPRITHVGQVLRWLKLDELPQLINVVRGDMSLVGPRPEDPHFVASYTEEQRRVLSVRPGIVGPAQIMGRDELEKYPDDVQDTEAYYVQHILPEKLATDLEYVEHCSFWGDLRLVVAGLAVTVFGSFKQRFLGLHRERIAFLAFDTAASLAAYVVAYGLKFGWGEIDADDVPYLGAVSLAILLIRPPMFLYFGLYQSVLRYLGTREFHAIVKSVGAGSLLVAASTYLMGLGTHSRAVFLIDAGLLVLALYGARVVAQSWTERRRRPGVSPRRVLIVGVDDTARQLVETMAAHDTHTYETVGFLDDDPAHQGMVIHGLPVRGRVTDLAAVTAVTPVDMVIVLFPHVSAPSIKHVLDHCRAQRLDYRLVPTLGRLLRGDVVLPEFTDMHVNGQTPSPEADAAARAAGERNGHAGDANGAGDRNGHGAESPRERNGNGARVMEQAPVLVTGGAGYVGSHVVRKLLAQGRRVRVLDSFMYGNHGLTAVRRHPNLELIEGDIRHMDTLTKSVKGIDRVIALAAIVGDQACDLDPDETATINLEATRLLAEVCQRAKVRRVVFASSCSVYGANSNLTLNEGSWLNPVSLYARTRIRSEAELLRRSGDLSIAILRLATVFGLSARMRLDLVVNTFTAHAYFNRQVRVFGGLQWRPNLHCQDAADAFIAAADAPDEAVRGEIFNVGDNGANHTIREVAEIVGRVVPDVKVEIIEASPDQRDYRVSFDKIKHVLGFRTRFTVEDGVREMALSFAAGELKDPDHDRYSNLRSLKTLYAARATNAKTSGVVA